MSEENRVASNEIALVWNPDTRIVRMTFSEKSPEGTGKDAEILLAGMRKWTDTDDRKFALLVDCTRLVNVDAGWRTAWSNQFKVEAKRGCIAWFNANAFIRVLVTMFITATKFGAPEFQGKAVATEAEALAWLKERGIG